MIKKIKLFILDKQLLISELKICYYNHQLNKKEIELQILQKGVK